MESAVVLQGTDIGILEAPRLLLAHEHLRGVQFRPPHVTLECPAIRARVANKR